MADPQTLIEHLETLRKAALVALEHLQKSHNKFIRDSTNSQVRIAQTSITGIRVLAGRLEKEFSTFEYLLAKAGRDS
jgi:hypothetical protein